MAYENAPAVLCHAFLPTSLWWCMRANKLLGILNRVDQVVRMHLHMLTLKINRVGQNYIYIYIYTVYTR
jgi:hypothetical protein